MKESRLQRPVKNFRGAVPASPVRPRFVTVHGGVLPYRRTDRAPPKLPHHMVAAWPPKPTRAMTFMGGLASSPNRNQRVLGVNKCRISTQASHSVRLTSAETAVTIALANRGTCSTQFRSSGLATFLT
jgi:hypothetical protein